MDGINFSRRLIEGKITELIFSQMFRASGEFTILPIGYENTSPELAQYQHLVRIQQVLENIRNAPDFALISQDKTEVFLVEVKFRSYLENKYVLPLAEELTKKWDPCYLFIATREKFYFDPCNTIINRNGEIRALEDRWIKAELQKEYLSLLREFIK